MEAALNLSPNTIITTLRQNALPRLCQKCAFFISTYKIMPDFVLTNGLVSSTFFNFSKSI